MRTMRTVSRFSEAVGGWVVLAATGCGFLTLSVAPASATLYTPTQSKPFSFDDLNDGTMNLTFNGFNSHLGTLTDLHLKIIVNTINVVDEVVSIQAGTHNFSIANASATGTITLTVAPPTLPTTYTLNYNLTTPAYSNASLSLTQSIPVNLNSASASGGFVEDELLSPPTNLSAFIGGTNSVPVTLSTIISTTGTKSSNKVFFGADGSASGSVELKYSYDPPIITTVPEPASIAFLTGGLLGIGVMRRRKRPESSNCG